MSKQKAYRVTIEFETIEIHVSAKNKIDARKHALERLNRKKPTSLIKKHWKSGRKEIDVDEW